MKPETIETKLAMLNQTQRDWMALDPSEANSPKGKDVFRRMRALPSAYLSYAENGQGTAIVGGSPLNMPIRIDEVLMYHGDKLDPHVAWNGSTGEWTMLPQA